MATIKERLKTDMVLAMKAKEKERLDTIRMILASVKKIEVDTRKDVDDAGLIAILNSSIKQHRDSIEQFTKGDRPELAAKEEAELKVIQSYLPAQISRAELEQIVAETIKELGAAGPKDMGAVMKALMPKVSGKAEGSAISEVVKSKLNP
jgi:uncharacterized protein YqeY